MWGDWKRLSGVKSSNLKWNCKKKASRINSWGVNHYKHLKPFVLKKCDESVNWSGCSLRKSQALCMSPTIFSGGKKDLNNIPQVQ